VTLDVIGPGPVPTGNGTNLGRIQVEPGGVALIFYGIPSQTYHMQRSVDLLTWTTIATLSAAPSGKIEFTDTAPLASAYYRTFFEP
jgi:hypothetical protein